MGFANPSRSKRSIAIAAIGVSIAGLVSSGHHWYGAVAYDTPWRFSVSLWIPAFVLLILSMLYLHWKYVDSIRGIVAVWIVFFGGVVFQAGFTLFECVYSHVLKDILFFVGAPQSTLQWLFPAPAYHPPDNTFFELTGVLQLVGFWAAWMAYRVFRDRPALARP